MHQIAFGGRPGPGSARPDPLGELERSPDRLAPIGGLLLREREGRVRKGGRE